MTDPIIRRLTAEDLDEALRLSTVAGWNQRFDDWRMLLQLAPAGAFAARFDARDPSIVGTAIGIDYGGFAWIAMMLVDPSFRGRGVGRRLLEAAIGSVPSNLPIRLDATPLGRPLYQRYGFEDEAALTRYVIDDASLAPPQVPRRGRAPPPVRPLTEADLAIVVEQDRETFGGTRGAVLDWAFRGAPQYAYGVRGDDGLNYCFGRQGRLFDQIGPVAASDDQAGHALVSAALVAAGGRRVVVDAFDASTSSAPRNAFVTALRADGFVVQRPLTRMCRPAESGACGPDINRRTVREVAILGPEFA
jgi:GNAT superfamily N-acetyltransferase